MDLDDPRFAMFVSQLESTGWKRGKGLGKNEDGETSTTLKTISDTRGIGWKQNLDYLKLDDVYAGKSESANDVKFVSSKKDFDKFATKKTDVEKKPRKIENAFHKKLDSIEAINVSLTFGRGKRSRGKLLRVQEQEKQMKEE
ncbi:hypothetical protein EIN_375070 [Entamoeba invadens IP1]|uniref:G-patch domain-containing protein n=1 Tax=Entamoeba invadens IP1 TaxID=370355 RepID=A0A0A1TU29_ENTIV|nr:hypothetical protein EIN_375070 [Entamoeba invadens IP1]ELP83432.1 hypothetical protein EIN_375070 [Entamoeba invadens IP1]|eukprot:XP_004182778.1 hypothetical protein EIN_375070 [Entamoeba invadens IP1]